MQKFEDQVLKLKHGDVLYCQKHNRISFVFRAAPIAKALSYGYCCCQNTYCKGHQGRVPKAYGKYRSRQGHQVVKWAEAHAQEGFKIRKGMRYLLTCFPKWHDDLPASYATKNWKHHRKHQWKQK
jgi:hypothetical protein